MKKGKEYLPLTTLSTSKEFKDNRPAFSLQQQFNNINNIGSFDYQQNRKS